MATPKERLWDAAEDLYEAADDTRDFINDAIHGGENRDTAGGGIKTGLERVKEAVKKIEGIIK